jgi:hypothetical protein
MASTRCVNNSISTSTNSHVIALACVDCWRSTAAATTTVNFTVTVTVTVTVTGTVTGAVAGAGAVPHASAELAVIGWHCVYVTVTVVCITFHSSSAVSAQNLYLLAVSKASTWYMCV